MNGIKGIGFELKDGSDYEGPFPILTGQTIDLDITAPAAATIVSRPSTSITRTNLSLKSWFTLSFTFYHLGTILTKVTRLIQIPSFKISTFWK